MKKAKFNRSLSVSFEPKMFDQIKEYSDQEEVSLSEWIRNSLSAYIKGEILELDKYGKND